MQFLPGRLRPYLSTAAMGATAGLGEHPLALLDQAIALLRLVVVIYIWRAVMASPLAAHTPPASAVVSYVVLAQLLRPQLVIDTGLLYSIWDGRVASRLLRPVSPFGDYLSEMAGDWLLRAVLFSLPGAGLSLVLGVRLGPAGAWRGAWFLASLALTVVVASAVDFLIALGVMMAPENLWAFRFARDGLLPLVSGLVIPLGLLPWGIGRVLTWLPFASMASAPLRIYTGQGSPGPLLVLQAAWGIGLWTVLRVTWRRSASKMVSFGG